jgi:hypothetical protein
MRHTLIAKTSVATRTAAGNAEAILGGACRTVALRDADAVVGGVAHLRSQVRTRLRHYA